MDLEVQEGSDQRRMQIWLDLVNYEENQRMTAKKMIKMVRALVDDGKIVEVNEIMIGIRYEKSTQMVLWILKILINCFWSNTMPGFTVER